MPGITDAAVGGLALVGAFQQFHDDEGMAIMGPDVMNRDDGGMRQARQDDSLALESGQGLPVMPGENIDCHITLEVTVLAAPHSAEAAAAKFLLNEIPAVQEGAGGPILFVPQIRDVNPLAAPGLLPK